MRILKLISEVKSDKRWQHLDDMPPPQLFVNRSRDAAGTKNGAGTKAGPGTKASAGTKAIPIPAPGHLVSRKPRDRDQ